MKYIKCNRLCQTVYKFILLLIISLSFSCQADFYDLASMSTYEEPEETTLEDITAPSDVDLKVTQSGGGAITLSWDEPTDEDYEYIIISWTSSSSQSSNITKGITTYEITGLTSGLYYTFKAQCVDTSGNISSGDSLSLTIPAVSIAISTLSEPTDLLLIDADPAGYYVISEDIILTSEWTPIASPFTGTLEGNGSTIYDLTTNNPTLTNQGFFETIDAAGIVQNLTLENPTVVFTSNGGAIAGMNYGIIDNCNVISANITGSTGKAGGLVGWNYGTISNCSSSGTITASSSYAGGISGFTSSGTLIEFCYSTATVNNTSSYAGGITGGIIGGMIRYCYSTGNVSAGNYAGGIAGGTSSNPTISNSYSRGSVSALSAGAGGLAGRLYTAITVEFSYATGPITGSSDIGGLFGETNAVIPTITGVCFYDRDTTGYVFGTWVEGGTATYTSDMITELTYTSNSWDFTGETVNGTNYIWSIDSSINNGYPYLTYLQP
jgi:hypothetical protein